MWAYSRSMASSGRARARSRRLPDCVTVEGIEEVDPRGVDREQRLPPGRGGGTPVASGEPGAGAGRWFDHFPGLAAVFDPFRLHSLRIEGEVNEQIGAQSFDELHVGRDRRTWRAIPGSWQILGSDADDDLLALVVMKANA